ncbi:hypothetical protein AJ78_00183 [Emergomyces pasteurianus Ep9510]|uniref:Uncharacterized protein n=1 Tax=Emergomyces pasteurianus Ep9510 TaxID=1447872 RepID=A0A1J9PTU2_9EURO|nr:hypothetical protein AJ78_00183 [Emergomyces pasteurianus Ep9510]
MHFFDTILPLALVAVSTTNAFPVLKSAPGAKQVPNSYIVVMKPNTTDTKFESHRSWVSSKMSDSSSSSTLSNAGVRSDFNFDDQFKAYSGVFDEDFLKQIYDDEDVDYIEPDVVVKLSDLVIQRDVPSWGLSRISSTKPGSTDFTYDSGAGEGITAYVIDTGIDVNHPDFGGRAVWGTNTVDSDDQDCGEHGTHVAGVIAGSTYGVAKKANLVGVKVFPCDEAGGATVSIIEGINWAVQHAKEHGDPKKSVMNLSLGGPYSRAFNEAVAAVIRQGFFVAVAAGNEDMDAANVSPASEPTVCTIGATNENDTIAIFSNFGSVVDLFAPGVDIISAMPGGKSQKMSGTSMATPHVAGLAASLMVRENISGGSVCERMKELAQDSVQNAPRGTTSKLIFDGAREGESATHTKGTKPHHGKHHKSSKTKNSKHHPSSKSKSSKHHKSSKSKSSKSKNSRPHHS